MCKLESLVSNYQVLDPKEGERGSDTDFPKTLFMPKGHLSR